MTKLAIQASNISKQYILGSSHRRKDSLREGIANALSEPIKGAIRSVRRLPKPASTKDNIF
ncbi:MAG TPA: hypothetical protein PLZ51_03020, partial [Aggregatilineales bacterium]|nr:hypothetical protein [Aggregatilineales bacterium]